jgi:uncharacterized protein YecE (DUF72 family)
MGQDSTLCRMRILGLKMPFGAKLMQVLAGTSGYSYKEWKGTFYPAKLAADEMLRFYAEHFKTVEINNTFYRMPDEAMLARWSEQVPSDFAFSVKAPRRISHEKRLREAESDVAEFLRRAAVLGNKLGPVLFQLPPFMRKDLPRLEEFLGLLPASPRAAFEFRHPSWQDDSVYEALRARAAMFCIADTDEGETPLVSTSDSGYLRLRREQYDDAELRAWAERIAAQPWNRAYVYFKHEDAGLGAKFAQRFNQLWIEGQGLS